MNENFSSSFQIITPEISIVITCHERKKFVTEAIESALNQTFPRKMYEVLLAIDFYDEAVWSFCQEKKVTILYDPMPSIGIKISIGLEKARGKIVCLLNDDDKFDSNKLKTIYQSFINDASVVYVHNNWHKINENGLIIKEVYGTTLKEDTLIEAGHINNKTLKTIAKGRYVFNDSSISIRRSEYSVFSKLIARVEGNQDNILFYLSMLTGKKALFLTEKLTYFRAYQKSTSTISSKDAKDYLFLINKRLISWFNLISGLNHDSFRTPILNAILGETCSNLAQYKILTKNNLPSCIDEYSRNLNLNNFEIIKNLARTGRTHLLFLFLLFVVRPEFSFRILKLLVQKGI